MLSRRRCTRRVAAFTRFLTLGLAILLTATTARAHPAGMTSTNRYVGIQCDGQGNLRIAYLLDFAELPSAAELADIDVDHDDRVTPAEQRAYLDRRLPPLVSAWTVEIDGARASPRITGSYLQINENEGAPPTLRIAADITAIRPPAASALAHDVSVFLRDPGFSSRLGWRELAGEDSAEAALAAGPKEKAADALGYSSLDGRPPRVDEAHFTFARRAAKADVPEPIRPVARTTVDPRLVRLSEAMKRASGEPLFSAIAVGWAILLGTVHALAPGHGKALAATYLVGRRALPLHAVVFGTTVTAAHTLAVFLFGALGWVIERWVGSGRFIGGIELASAVTVLLLGVTQLSKHWQDVTSLGHDSHHDAPPTVQGGMRSIVTLGASAGLAPCPSAMAVLLSAVALHQFGLGLVLVFAFSCGVAVTLTAIGLLVVTARSFAIRIAGASAVMRWLPVASSACVLVLGLLLCVSAWSAVIG